MSWILRLTEKINRLSGTGLNIIIWLLAALTDGGEDIIVEPGVRDLVVDAAIGRASVVVVG